MTDFTRGFEIGIQLLTKELREETLASEKKVRVLRLMALITREQYPEGKLEILRCATQLMQEPTEAVRTADGVPLGG